MGKSLIIAEKPSVAQDIVRALTPVSGKFDKHEDHFENEQYVVTSAVGHLVEIKAPEEYDVKRGKWSFAHLPVIPPHFDLAPIDKAKSRLNAVVKQIRRKDVTTLINACDAGREGELIFRLIVQYAQPAKGKLDKPVQRLWLQSMTPAAIREGFERLRSDQQMLPLADAARCRSEADWLVGINGTRAMTAFNSRDGGFFLTTVGRPGRGRAGRGRRRAAGTAPARNRCCWTGRRRRRSATAPAAARRRGRPARRRSAAPGGGWQQHQISAEHRTCGAQRGHFHPRKPSRCRGRCRPFGCS